VPQTPLERLLALVALAAILGLVALLIPAWQEYQRNAEPRSTASTPPASAPPAPAATETATSTQPTTTAPAPKRPTPRRAVLEFVAARGSSWISARADSATGPLLYEGVLLEGRTLTLTRRRLWLRLGAPQNLDARLNGKRLADLPQDVADVIVTRTGMQVAP
jgi:hypothetical protein